MTYEKERSYNWKHGLHFSYLETTFTPGSRILAHALQIFGLLNRKRKIKLGGVGVVVAILVVIATVESAGALTKLRVMIEYMADAVACSLQPPRKHLTMLSGLFLPLTNSVGVFFGSLSLSLSLSFSFFLSEQQRHNLRGCTKST